MNWYIPAAAVPTLWAILWCLILFSCYRMFSYGSSVGNEEQTSWTTEMRDKNRVTRKKKHVFIQMSSQNETEV